MNMYQLGLLQAAQLLLRPDDHWSVNAHLISGPTISTKHKHSTYKTWVKMAEHTLTLILITHNHSFNHLVNNILVNPIQGHRMKYFPKNPSLSHFSIENPKLQNFTLP